MDPRAYRRPVAARWRGVGEAALLTLVGGLFVLCGLAVVFAKLLDSVLEGDGIALVDRPISGWLAAHREHWLTLAMRAFTELSSPAGVTVAAAVSRWGQRRE